MSSHYSIYNCELVNMSTIAYLISTDTICYLLSNYQLDTELFLFTAGEYSTQANNGIRWTILHTVSG